MIGVSSGDPAADPMSVMAGSTRIAAMLASSGTDLSDNAAITEMTGINDPQMFTLTGSNNLDATKAAFRFLAHRARGAPVPGTRQPLTASPSSVTAR